jgi:leader peptidase (prepilin peptidase)/N-methyltransferase
MPPPFTFEPEPIAFPLGLKIFLAVWFFYVGGCIGSFMNVVIFRVPRGRSVVAPGSRCPRCGSAIRWYDNLPIVSWLMLRAKCRDCGVPIPARYVIVELLVGLVFFHLAAYPYLTGAPWLVNVPRGGMLSIDWPLLALAYVYYALLISTLICAAYIAWDGERVPRRIFLPVVLAGAIVPLYWNEIRPFGQSSGTVWNDMASALRLGVVGAASGIGLGIVFDYFRNLRNTDEQPRGRITLALATVGWLLGAEVVLLVGSAAMVFACVWLVLTRTWRGASSAPLVGVAVATWGAWQLPLTVRFDLKLVAVATMIVFVAALLLRKLGPAPPLPDSVPSSPDMIYP